MGLIDTDSCIVIYLIEGDFSGESELRNICCAPSLNRTGSVFFDLTRMECLIHPVRERNVQLRSAYETFFTGSCSDYIPLTSDVFEKATELRAEYHVKTPDAIHLAAALVGDCDIFLTNDLRLNRVDVGISVEVPPF